MLVSTCVDEGDDSEEVNKVESTFLLAEATSVSQEEDAGVEWAVRQSGPGGLEVGRIPVSGAEGTIDGLTRLGQASGRVSEVGES